MDFCSLHSCVIYCFFLFVLVLLRWITWAHSFRMNLYLRCCLGENVMMMAIKMMNIGMWVSPYVCMRACFLCPKLYRYIYYIAKNSSLVHHHGIPPDLLWNAEPGLASSLVYILFVHCRCSLQKIRKNQQQPEFKRFWCVTVHARVFFFVSIFTALSTLNPHSTHATVEFQSRPIPSHVSHSIQGNVNTIFSGLFFSFIVRGLHTHTISFLFQSQVYRSFFSRIAIVSTSAYLYPTIKRTDSLCMHGYKWDIRCLFAVRLLFSFVLALRYT